MKTSRFEEAKSKRLEPSQNNNCHLLDITDKRSSHGRKDGLPAQQDTGGGDTVDDDIRPRAAGEGGGVQREEELLGEQGEPDDDDDSEGRGGETPKDEELKRYDCAT